MSTKALKLAPDFSDIQSNAPFDIAGRVNQIFGYRQASLDTSKKLDGKLSEKELRYLALVKMLAQIRPEVEKLVDSPNGGLDARDINTIQEKASLSEALDYLTGALTSKVQEKCSHKLEDAFASLPQGTPTLKILGILDGRLNNALRNAFQTIMGLVDLIPRAYRQKFGKAISVEDFKKAVDGVYNIFTAMSHMHVVVFNTFVGPYFDLAIGGKRDFHDFKEELFDFYDKVKDKLLLIPSRKFFEMMQAEKFSEHMQTIQNAVQGLNPVDDSERQSFSCPAHYVQTKHGNMIRSFYLWSKKLIEQVIYPELPRLLGVQESA